MFSFNKPWVKLGMTEEVWNEIPKSDQDRLEAAGEAFHDAVRQSFLELASQDPEHYLVLDARGTREAIAARIRERLAPLLSVVVARIEA